MKFWDSSALVPLLTSQPSTKSLESLYAADAHLIVWWATPVECVSGLSRLEREGGITARELSTALERLARLSKSWDEIQPNSRLRDLALRMLRNHPLRAADALQLAAGIVASEHNATTLPFVCLDNRLAEAAAKEGFRIVVK